MARRHTPALIARAALLTLACAAGGALAQPAPAAPAPGAQEYRIAPGPLQDALARFATEAGISLTMPQPLVQGRSSPGLQGRFGVPEGLARLLAGTGLEVDARTPGVYVLRAVPEVRSAAPATLGEVRVTAEAERGGATEGSGSYTARASSAATQLELTQRETPQSVTVITRQQMDDQGVVEIADALRQAPGITVSRANTEGYNFYARGFQVENFQLDGVPSLSTNGNNVRDNYSITDAAIYDRVEILKGATGLVNGAGYPAGVVNLVRKRPTAQFQGRASVAAASWDDYRADVDLSSPLTEDGRIRARLVAAAQNSGSFIDHLTTRQQLLYSIAEADVAPSTTLAVGFNVQQNKHKGTTNAHLPAFFSDGTAARFPRSANAADAWAYRNQDTRYLFATLAHDFGGGWNLKAHLGQRDYQSREVIAGMISWNPIDRATNSIGHGFGAGSASQFNTDTVENNLDVQVSGQYTLGGRAHRLVLGYGAARTKATSIGANGSTDVRIPDVFQWGNNAARPAFYEWGSTFDIAVRHKIGYAATVLQPTDRLSLILGARVTDYDWSQYNVFASGAPTLTATRVHGKVIPYAGVTFDVDGQHTVYTSYTDVFKPQAYNFDANDRQLDPLTGESYEVGVKGSYLGGKLNASAALFQLQQDNYAVADPSGARRPSNGAAAYVPMRGVTTRGLELELFGEVLPGWQLGSGVTYIRPRDMNGQRVSPTQPEKSFKLATMVRLPGDWRHVRLGGSVQWQSGTYFTQTIAGALRRFAQPAYAVAGLSASVALSQQLKAAFHIDNLFDKHYYAGIGQYNAAYWGAPRSYKLNLHYDF